jgi:phospholipase D-like protein
LPEVMRGSSELLSVTAYAGDAKTLLAFNMRKRDTRRLAGFTIEVKPQGQHPYYLFNFLRFEYPERHAQDPREPPNSSLNAPLHKFRWVHVPGVIHQGLTPFFGPYAYVVTPRYFDGSGSMLPLDATKSVSVDVRVAPFDSGVLQLGFTRGYVQSQAFVGRFGPKAHIRPGGKDLLFDTSQVAGANARGEPYTYADEYDWLGFTAREKVFGLLDEVRGDPSLRLDVFAYDFNEPDIARALLALAAEGRVRIILDNAALHHSRESPTLEDHFEQQFNDAATGAAAIKRGKFAQYAHDKVLVVHGPGGAKTVLTGSTNFSVTGLYVNSNHVLVFDDVTIARTYAGVFDQVWDEDVKRAAFVASGLSRDPTTVPSVGDPAMQITFAPHSEEVAAGILDGIVKRINAEKKRGRRGNVLFAVMAIDTASPSQVWRALRTIHADDHVFSFGVSDAPDGISLYEPKRKTGVLVTGKPVNTQLPPPFNQVPGVGSGHQIHHKFVICGFNGPAPVVYCGSSNLAPGGEQKNGDNLLEIHDPEVVTAFTIEALLLVDHFQFLDRTAKGPKAKAAGRRKPPDASRTGAAEDAGWFLSTTDSWVAKYYDPSDLHQVDRLLFGPEGSAARG